MENIGEGAIGNDRSEKSGCRSSVAMRLARLACSDSVTISTELQAGEGVMLRASRFSSRASWWGLPAFARRPEGEADANEDEPWKLPCGGAAD